VIVDPYLLLAATTLLIVVMLVSRRSVSRRFDDAMFRDDTPGPEQWDSLSLELGAQIFSSEDLDFVAQGSSSKLLRSFREERAALALEWLEQVRDEIGRSMGEHVRGCPGKSRFKNC